MITFVHVVAIVDSTGKLVILSVLPMFLIGFKMLFSVSLTFDDDFWDFWNHKTKGHLEDHHKVLDADHHSKEFD
jgi:hypothetical protein